MRRRKPRVGKPLSSHEKKLLGMANVWIMDVEMDSPGWLSRKEPEIERIYDLGNKATPDELRQLIAFMHRTAPGDF